MTSAIPGHAAAEPGPAPRSAPIAWISRRALSANARTARASGIHSYDASVLQADAWGHGEHLVRDVLATEGFGLRREAEPVVAALQLFGLPGADHSGVPALRLTGTVLSVKDLRRGEGVSYGYAYRADADTRVALVTGGYAQGIVRALGGAVDVAIAGERHPVVGRIAMDVCVVNIADAAVGRGDEVLFLGDPAKGEPSLGEWMRTTKLTGGELITTVGLRAVREEAP